jgi:FkbH-like protein
LFESEVPYQRGSVGEFPREVLIKFSETARLVSYRSTNVWREHCSECAMPSCYSTCSLYEPRADLKCRRFRDGFVAISSREAAVADILKVTFKKWAKLEASGTSALLPLEQAIRRESRDARFDQILNTIPIPFGTRVYAIRARQRAKSARSRRFLPNTIVPNCFVIETFNPTRYQVHSTLTMRPVGQNSNLPFQVNLTFPPGYNRHLIAMTDISRCIDLSSEFIIGIEPGDDTGGATIYFGLIDFAYISSAKLFENSPPLELVNNDQKNASEDPSTQINEAKCVIWDLDNTIWKGTLIEDGLEKLKLNFIAIDKIRELDRRGILNSIASKNNMEDAFAALKHFQIEEYFVSPQISWEPKSSAITKIGNLLNIGTETFVFVDDQAFERAEVASVHPNVLSVSTEDLDTLLDHPTFKVPITAEGSRRRLMYRQQAERNEALIVSGNDYAIFLRSCDLRLTISEMNNENIERVNELAQRTNQMNFSGNRYSVKALQGILDNDQMDSYVLRASDKFGEYGLIGFCVVDHEIPRMLDLMFSCRIQHKGVDNAFLSHLLAYYSSRGKNFFEADYNETVKNRDAAQLFWDLGFEKIARDDGRYRLRYDILERGVPSQNIVRVITK